jgi:predicted permease
MLHELRYALRRLRSSPAFSVTAIVTLALAIGASVAMFGVLDAVLLRPLPFPSPDRLVTVWTEIPNQNVREGRSAFGTADEWRRRSRTVEDLAVLDPVSMSFTHTGELEQVSGSRVSPNLFGLLGVVPVRGRLFTDQDAADRRRLAVVSHRFWQARFGGSAGVIGATVLIDGQPSQIVGVLPAGLAQAGFDADVWEPHTLFADWETRRTAVGRGSWFVIGRLRAGAGMEPAARELAAIARDVDASRPGPDIGRSVRVVPLREQLTGTRSPAVIWVLAGAALLLWIVAAVNVAGLSLARGIGRLPQLAIEVALGASRGRVIGALLAESALLAAMAGAAGLGIAVAAIRAIRTIGPAYVARLQDVTLDLRVCAWAVALSAVTALLVGLAPAVSAWRRDLRVTGVDGGRSASAGTAARLRRLFVVTECAAAIVLLAGAGLLVRSWWNVSRVDPGFHPEGVLSLGLSSPVDMPEAQRGAFYEAVLDRVAAVPGIERTGISSELFVGNVAEQLVTAEGGDVAEARPLQLRRDEIAGDVFETLGTPLLHGRAFIATDGRGPAPMAIVNAALAGRLWPGRDAVGRRFRIGGPGAETPWFTVVGVVGDMRRQGLETAPVPQMFEPVAQASSRRVILFVRTSLPDPTSRTAALRAAVRSVDPRAFVYGTPALVGDRLGQALAERRVQTAVLLGCAAMALLLSTLGLYGLIQYSVVTRTHEIGVRMALGARGEDIGRMVVGEGLALAVAGLIVGLVGAWWLARTASTLLFGVGAFDPPTIVAVSTLALAVAAAAAWLPARRAARVAPIIALRRRAL